MNRIRSSRVLASVAWLAALTAVLGIALHAWGSQLRAAVLLTAGAPYLMYAALLAVALFVLARRWRGAVVAVVLAMAGAATQLPMYLADASAPTGPTVTVLQTNMWFGNGDSGTIVAAVREHTVDVVTVNELTPDAVARLQSAGLDSILPHKFVEPGPGGAGTGIWSRYPLRNTAKFDGFTLHHLSATMMHPQAGAVGVYAFHPLAPVFGVQTWHDQLRRIGEILDADRHRAAIVGADFNATPDHANFRDIVRGRFTGATDGAGAGSLRTYPTGKPFPPLIGIDHVLVAGGSAEAVWTRDIPGADHRAVLARLRLDDSATLRGDRALVRSR